MKYSLKMLKDKIPYSVYNALKLDKASELAKVTKEELDKAVKVLDCTPPAHWAAVSYRRFTDEEIKATKKCTVISTEFGKSVRFDLYDHEPAYIPIMAASWEEGQELNITELKLVLLNRWNTEDEIYRVIPIDSKEETYFTQKHITPKEAKFRNKLWGKLFCMLRDVKFTIKDSKLNPFSYMHVY